MVRNFDGIQFEKLRRIIDNKYNQIHDELSDCYYNKTPFREYGILTKEQFDKLHGLIFLIREVKFHEENLKQPIEDIILEEKYNNDTDRDGNIIAKKNEQAALKIDQLKAEGFELEV